MPTEPEQVIRKEPHRRGAPMNRNPHPRPAAAAACFVIASSFLGTGVAAEKAVPLPPPAQDMPATGATETAVFAGGCFGAVQAVFQHHQRACSMPCRATPAASRARQVRGVGFRAARPRRSRCRSRTTEQVSYSARVLQVYFSGAHDPHTLNRQGPDAGTQYRSAVFYANAQQKRITENYIRAAGCREGIPGEDRSRGHPARSVLPARPTTRTTPR
jgi:peptide-methionine (S)-S-oxide reductase